MIDDLQHFIEFVSTNILKNLINILNQCTIFRHALKPEEKLLYEHIMTMSYVI